jgi:bifunctional polynucleotide phosphatase/kinase
MNTKNNNKWINMPTFTYYDNIPTTKLNTYKNVIIFDLDGTVIKTKSGRTFPTNSSDWIFNYDSVVNTLNSLNSSNNTIIGIISNQKGIKSEFQMTEWQSKLNNIMKQVNFHFIFASFKDDRYRKPMIGSWEYIKDRLKGLEVPHTQIIYVGDACGRENPKDHSDTDIKFALNCDFKFYTPEKFFKIKVGKQIATITYPDLIYYTKTEFNKIIKNIMQLFKENDKVLITMIGFPSSGKSYIRKLFINEYSNFKYTNKDDIKNKVINNNLVSKHDENIDFVIDDNTNMSLKNRKDLFKIYKSHYKIGIYFDYEIDLSMHLNFMRMYWYGSELIKKVAYYTLNKNFDIPNEKEFDMFVKLDKVIPDFNLDTSLKYYF